MNLQHEQLYHVYNRGNNKEPLFFNDDNYRHFLHKMRALLLPEAHLLAWCLMPNHFHLLVELRSTSSSAEFSAGMRTLLSSYTRGINTQEERTGSLFQQQTKARMLDTENYALHCFCYIHQNPQRAGLEKKAGAWPWSSFRDYVGLRSGTLCDQKLATQLLDLPADFAERRALLLQVLPEDVKSGMY